MLKPAALVCLWFLMDQDLDMSGKRIFYDNMPIKNAVFWHLFRMEYTPGTITDSIHGQAIICRKKKRRAQGSFSETARS